MPPRIAFASLPALALAACAEPAALEASHAWTRATPAGSPNAAVFMTLRSPAPDRLLSASTPAAERTDLMTMESGGGAMKMSYLKAIEIPAGRPVSLHPAGLHVWLAGLRRPLRAGEAFPLTLRFETAGERTVAVSVIGPAEPPPAP